MANTKVKPEKRKWQKSVSLNEVQIDFLKNVGNESVSQGIARLIEYAKKTRVPFNRFMKND